jgi:toxin ParE1/3/4
VRKIRFHPAAALEMGEAAEHYRSIRPKLNVYFVEDLDLSIKLLRQHPGIGSVASKNLRKKSLVGFPYNIIYLDAPHDDLIIVFALAHHSRQPGYWSKRT